MESSLSGSVDFARGTSLYLGTSLSERLLEWASRHRYEHITSMGASSSDDFRISSQDVPDSIDWRCLRPTTVVEFSPTAIQCSRG